MPKANICPVCSKGFAKPAHLLRHSLVHTQRRHFECDICQTQFGRHDSFKRHQIRVHGQSGSLPRRQSEEQGRVKREDGWEETKARRGGGMRGEGWNEREKASGGEEESHAESLRMASLLTSFSSAPQPRPDGHHSLIPLDGQCKDDSLTDQHRRLPPLDEERTTCAGEMLHSEPSLEEILESILATSFDSLSSSSMPSTGLYGGAHLATLQPSNALTWATPNTPCPQQAPSKVMQGLRVHSTKVKVVSTELATQAPNAAREGAAATAQAAHHVVAQSKDYVVHGVRLPQMPTATSTEELFWLTSNRLSTLVPVINFTRDEQSAMSKEDPVMFIIALAFGTLWHKASQVREYGVALWKFAFSSVWTASGFVMDDVQKMKKSRTIALYAHLFAFMCADVASYRKAAHGFMTCRSVSKEAIWRRQRQWKGEDDEAGTHSLRHLWLNWHHHRSHSYDRSRLADLVEERWQVWRETEVQNRTSLALGIMDSQMLSFAGSNPDDVGRGGRCCLRETLVNVLVQSLEPSSEEAWAARTAIDWLAVVANDGRAVGSTEQIGNLLANLICDAKQFARQVRFSSPHHLTMSALLEGLHFAWMGRKEEDEDWIRDTTALFHPSPPRRLQSAEAGLDGVSEAVAAASRSVTHPTAILDGLTTWMLHFEPGHDSLQLHLRWHAICLEVCVEPWQICTHLVRLAELRRGRRGRPRSERDIRPGLDSARFRRAVYHSAAILSLYFHIAPSSAVSMHCAQALCFGLAVLTSVVLGQEAGDFESQSGQHGPINLTGLPNVCRDRLLGRSGWPIDSTVSIHSEEQIVDWIHSGSSLPPLFHHLGLTPSPPLSHSLLKHVLFEVRAIAPLAWHKSQDWLSLITSAIC